MMKRKVRLKVKTASSQTIRMLGHNLSARCPRCEGEVETLSKDEAARALAIGELALEELIAAGEVNVIETVSGTSGIAKTHCLPPPDSET